MFREKGVTDNSRKSLKTKLGGARSVLEVIVTNNELWIRSHLLFAAFSNAYDLPHKVKLSNILKTERYQTKVSITFLAFENTETKIDLKMKKA